MEQTATTNTMNLMEFMKSHDNMVIGFDKVIAVALEANDRLGKKLIDIDELKTELEPIKYHIKRLEVDFLKRKEARIGE